MVKAEIYIDQERYMGDQSLHDFVMQFLLEQGIAGATSFRAHAAFGRHHRIKRPHELFSFDEPSLMITFIDEDEKVRETVKKLRTYMEGGLIIIHKIEIL
ncbi:MAG TPA: DUF190 domain-containing protein [Ohtaekwangia sp.]|uniref:DUF190 domain-containing protein n=1 Tax=Ohtaekwangia sp. TaxID=2066019 RepID=UPI002F94E4B2